MKIVCISDTHGLHDQIEVPDGDVLVHAGDLTSQGTPQQMRDVNDWFGSLPHRYKIAIAGNHDWCLQGDPSAAKKLSNVTYLLDSHVEIEGFIFYGSPWQPEFGHWAFNLPRGEPLREKWRQIPQAVDVLITHGPPMGYGDRTRSNVHAGCADLKDALVRTSPKLHVFGHIHEGYGQYQFNDTALINASVVTWRYQVKNTPPVYYLERG